jgi:penicillin-binding protein-related factor A (putative recombinase)
MSKRTPEQMVKTAILKYLSFKREGKFWMNKSTGTYDPVRKIFRKNRSKWEILGVSDILGIYREKFIAIEVKSAKGRASPEQVKFIAEINRLGGVAFIARGVEDVERELKRADGGRDGKAREVQPSGLRGENESLEGSVP